MRNSPNSKVGSFFQSNNIFRTPVTELIDEIPIPTNVVEFS